MLAQLILSDVFHIEEDFAYVTQVKCDRLRFLSPCTSPILRFLPANVSPDVRHVCKGMHGELLAELRGLLNDVVDLSFQDLLLIRFEVILVDFKSL